MPRVDVRDLADGVLLSGRQGIQEGGFVPICGIRSSARHAIARSLIKRVRTR